MDQFGLQLLQTRLGLLALGEIADKAGEKVLRAGPHLADRQLHRKGRAILALPDHDAANADDAALAGLHVAGKIAVVLPAIRRRHQHLDVLPDDFSAPITKQPLGRGTERLHDAAVVDHDHGVRNGVENRMQMRLARVRRIGVGGRQLPGAAQQFTAP